MKTSALPLSLLALLFALPSAATGCGRTACIEWSAAEGVCPAQSEALAFFTDPNCGGTSILTVESEGDYDEGLCCYSVTKRDDYDDGAAPREPCFGGTEVGSGGVGGVGPGGVGGGPIEPGSGGFGGGTEMCATCEAVLTTGSSAPLCPGSQELFDAVAICACEGACAPSCGDNACAGTDTSADCTACLQDTAVGCGNEFTACANDL